MGAPVQGVWGRQALVEAARGWGTDVAGEEAGLRWESMGVTRMQLIDIHSLLFSVWYPLFLAGQRGLWGEGAPLNVWWGSHVDRMECGEGLEDEMSVLTWITVLDLLMVGIWGRGSWVGRLRWGVYHEWQLPRTVGSKASETTAWERDGVGRGLENEPTASFHGLGELNC